MKIVKGKLTLDKRDFRVGNFVFTREPEHIKVQDIGQMVAHRISVHIAKGQLLDMMLADKEKYAKMLEMYAVSMYNVLSVAPDMTFYEEVYKSTEECARRHADVYGLKENVSDEEDAKILKEERELEEAKEEILAKTSEEEEQ